MAKRNFNPSVDITIYHPGDDSRGYDGNAHITSYDNSKGAPQFTVEYNYGCHTEEWLGVVRHYGGSHEDYLNDGGGGTRKQQKEVLRRLTNLSNEAKRIVKALGGKIV